MIARFKPTPRLITVAAALIALAIAGITFTGAAEKDKPKKSDKPAREADLVRPGSEEARIQLYEKEIAKTDEQIRKAQMELDKLREELGITTESEKADPGDTLRQLERERIIAQSEYAQVQSLYTQLARLSRPELIKLAPTASPDPILIELYTRKQTAEQNYAEAAEAYGEENPDVRRKARLVKIVNEQINERLDGMLQGLKVKAETFKQRVDSLKAEVEKYKLNDISSTIKRTPYYQKKRELETLHAMRERLQFRLLQEKVDAFAPEKR